MLNKYYVQILSLNKSGGNSEEIIRLDTYEAAEAKYYDKCSSYCGNAQTGYVVIQFLDSYGRTILRAEINHLPEPEPSV